MPAPQHPRRRASLAIVTAFVTVLVMVGGLAGARASEPAVPEELADETATVVEAGASVDDAGSEIAADPVLEAGSPVEALPGETTTVEAPPGETTTVDDPGASPPQSGGIDAPRATPPDLLLRPSPPGQVDRGAPFARSFTVRNRGGQTATGVEITARLPAGVRIVGVLPEMDGGTCTVVSVADGAEPSVIAVCTRRSLEPGAQAAMRLTLEATPTARCGPLVVTAAARAANEPPAKVGAENRSRVPDRLVCARGAGPDLSVSSTSDAGEVESPGARFDYRIEVRNDGDATARGVSIDDSLPLGLRVVGMPAVPGGVCTVASSVVVGGAEHWSFACRIAELEAGASVSLVATAEVLPDPPCGPAVNIVRVAARNEPDVNVGGENGARVRTTLACPPSLEVEIIAPGAVHDAGSVDVRIAVRNASGTELRDVRAHGSPCGPIAFDRLDPGQTRTVGCRRSITGADGDPVRLAVTFAGRDRFGQRAVGRAAASIDVLHPAIGLTVTADPASGAPGQLVTYRYVVRNLGDTPLSGVVIRDPAVGRVGAASALAPGATLVATASARLPSSGGAVGRTVEVRGSDRLGLEVTAVAPLSVTVVRAAGPSPGATAFTGADADRTASLMIVLTVVGLLALAASRTRVRPTPDAD